MWVAVTRLPETARGKEQVKGMRDKNYRRTAREQQWLESVSSQMRIMKLESLTIGVWCRLYNMQKFHVRDVIYVDLHLEYYHQCLAVELDGKNR